MMQYAFLLIRLLCLALSLCGYLLWLRKDIRMELALGLLLSGIGSMMFLAGIAHILQETAWLVFAGGLWLLFQACRKNKDSLGSLLKDFCRPGIVLFAALSVFFLYLFFENKFIHYDDFSHWGVAAKVISQKDMFPNSANANVTFTSYPLGSSAFIYFITEIAGSAAEWLQMWAQAVLMAGMLTSLFAFGNGVVCVLTAVAGTGMLLCGNTPLINLLVDTLLPVVTVAAMAFCIFYREELPEKIWYVIPYGVFLVSIKNSGILFAVLLLAYVFLAVPVTRENRNKLLAVVLAPLATIFFWNKHVEQLFDNGTTSKHAMRLDNFSQILAEKTPEDLLLILKAFADETAAYLEPVLYLCLLGMLLLVFRKWVLKKECRELVGLLLFAAVSYAAFLLGLLGMYIFSMPLDEALMMAGYGRYHQTIVVFAAGILLMAALREIPQCRVSKAGSLGSLVLAAVVLMLVKTAVGPNISYLVRRNMDHTDRAHFDRLISDYEIPAGDSYLILADEAQAKESYLVYMSYYLLAPEKVALETASSARNLEENRFNYVIMFTDTEENREYLQTQFGLTEEFGYIAGKPLQ